MAMSLSGPLKGRNLNPNSLVLVLLGKTGSGKSTLGNELVGKLVFEARGGPVSVTEHCSAREGLCANHQLFVIDTPGTMDVRNPQRAIAEIRRAIDNCPEGVDAFLVVVNWSARFTEEEACAIEVAVNVFGSECYKRTVVVFSHVDQNTMVDFENTLRQIRTEVPRLDQLLNKLCNRYCPMDNEQLQCTSETKQQQLRKLIDLCDSVSSNNPVRYRRMELEMEERRQEEERKRLEEERRREREEMDRRESKAQRILADLERYNSLQAAGPSVAARLRQFALNTASSVIANVTNCAVQTFVHSAMQNRSNLALRESSLQTISSSNPAGPNQPVSVSIAESMESSLQTIGSSSPASSRQPVPVSNAGSRLPSLQTIGSSNLAGSKQPGLASNLAQIGHFQKSLFYLYLSGYRKSHMESLLVHHDMTRLFSRHPRQMVETRRSSQVVHIQAVGSYCTRGFKDSDD